MTTNWSTGVVPTAGSAVVVNTTLPNPVIINGGNAVADGMSVGLNSTGMLTISNGGTLMSNLASVGNLVGSTGTATITGAGSLWNAQGMAVGYRGAGTLAILNGGAVNTTDWEVSMGDQSGSSGSVTVDGAGSTLTGSDIVVGNGGTGTLMVSNGGTVSATKWTSIIGHSAGSVGTATITGAGSRWSNASDFYVGQNGIGSLTIANGGAVSVAGNVVLGYQAGSSGTATVTGAGSVWTNSGDVDVGRSGSGVLTIANGGAVSAAGFVTLATMAGSVGTLNIGGAAGAAAVAAGTLNAATIQFGAGAGAINFNHTSTSYAFASAISGLGTINQVAGTTILTADSSGFTGATNVSGGRLAVNGSLANSIVTASGGGMLGGNGIVGGIVANAGGIIGPGNSIGTLNVNGNVAFAAGSTYQVEVNAAGQSDKIAASGTATLNGGTVSVLIAPGAFTLGGQYTILTAAGGINGAFAGASATTATPFLALGLTYDPNNVYLGISRSNVTFASAGLTPNQIATGGGADSLALGSSLVGALAYLDLTQASGALDQLSGEVHASAKGVMVEDSRFLREAAMDRLRAAFDGVGAVAMPVMAYAGGEPMLAPATTDRFAAWGRGFGSWGQWNGDGNAATIKRDIGGFFVGADGLVADTWRVGAVSGYSRSNFRVADRNSSGSSDNYHAGLYGGTQWGDLAFRSGLAYTRHDISTGRSVAFPGFADTLKGDYSAGTTQTFGELGYRIKAGQNPLGNLAFEPFANLAYVNLSTNGFTEKGGAAALTSQGGNTGVTFSTLGLRTSTGFTLGNGVNMAARGMLGWRHAFGDTTPVSTVAFTGGSPFSIAGVPVARDGAVADLGLDLNLTPNAALGLTYGGQFGSGVTDQTVRGNFAVRF
ncbi:autotransporter outer membrane beta-barrel domain-containing protein [Bradyrhizobium sediminis]|uniref:Autotransporter outer membrane beta-barrel domain-containing protein n=1 Tax=Bradyrhizobium sediminis TaxID=2840469 RepID=A0A975RTF4_9BRAD|nr:autotransporter domain-containing protein [Bradyrhizobium sediminis]QWG18721.1 autotransporter outer membrane beta-barrel domain-containing protein [Bradyrhizobium sediminis]